MAAKIRMIAVGLLALAAGAGLSSLGDAAAQLPGVPTTTTGTTQSEPPPPPPPPVADPGPPSDVTSHVQADPARRGSIAGGGLRPPLRHLWRHDFDGRAISAVVGDGRVYVLTPSRVVALKLDTGQPLWTSAADLSSATAAFSAAGMAFGGGKLVISGGDGVIALDAATGAVAWTAGERMSTGRGAPLIAGNLVIVQYQGLKAYDLATGARRWAGGTDDGVDGAPAAAGDRVFNAGGCTVAATDRRNGRSIWTRNFGCTGGGDAALALHGSRVHADLDEARSPLSAANGHDVPAARVDIVAGDVGLQHRGKDLAAVSLTDGRLLWRAPGSGGPDDYSDSPDVPLVVGDAVYRARLRGVEARSLATGAMLWRADLRPATTHHTGSTSASWSSLAGGTGVLVVLRGSTVDGLASAAEPPRALALTVPRMASRLVESGDELSVSGTVSGEILPEHVGLETDAHPYDRFEPSGLPVRPDEKGKAGLSLTSDRNVRVRLTGTHNSTYPTPHYTYFVYPRIRMELRNVRNRVRAKVSVRGSSAVRFRRRKVHVYIARPGKGRMTRLGSARLTGPRTGRGRATVRFRALRRIGRRDFLFACVPGVHRLGQGFGDPVQRRCGRRSLRF